LSLGLKRLAKNVSYWELWGQDKYFALPHPVHAWSEQESTLASYVSLNKNNELKLNWAREWLRNRDNQEFNSFAHRWRARRATVEGGLQQNAPLLAVFPSSSDEVGSISQAELSELGNQSNSMERVIGHFCKLGFQVKVRLHPNLLTKPLREYRREIKRFKKIARENDGVLILKPDSKTNSYGLIEEADLVYVHGSSIGAEASAMGKRVFTSQRTAFSTVTDVVELISPADFSIVEVSSKEPDSRKALIYLEWTHRHRIKSVPADLRVTHRHKLSIDSLLAKLSIGVFDFVVALWILLRSTPVLTLRNLKNRLMGLFMTKRSSL
jgi:hypothetical protein